MGRRYTKALAPTLLGSKRGQPKGGEGAVRASAREAYGGPDDIGFEDGRVLDHPILRELALFRLSGKEILSISPPFKSTGPRNLPSLFSERSSGFSARGEAGAER